MTVARQPETDVEYFTRTHHCGHCGQPGSYCMCTKASRCGCRHLHEMGSGRAADALEAFAEPVPVSDDQEGLF